MKRLLAYIIVICILTTQIVHAGGSDYHDKHLRELLFVSGKPNSRDSVQTEELITMLEYASYLAIDQAGNRPGDEGKLTFLRTHGVKGIIKSIAETNPQNAFYHRSYTHRGWDYNYVDDKYNWIERKALLVNTVETVFNFNKYYSTSEATKKREALCKLIYYEHLLGDWSYDDTDTISQSSSTGGSSLDKERGLMIAFAYKHPSETNKDILFEIADACNILFFSGPQDSRRAAFKQKLEVLAKSARKDVGEVGEIKTIEAYELRLKYECELQELLNAYVPLLLDDEKFFRATFPI